MEHATIKLNELGRAKIHDEQGNEYYITGINVSAQEDLDITVEAIETVEKVVTNQFAQTTPKPDFDRISKYIFDCLVTENMVNPESKIGVVKDFIKACVRAAAFLDNNHYADPETRPE